MTAFFMQNDNDIICFNCKNMCSLFHAKLNTHLSTHQYETCRYCTKDTITYDFELF